MLTYADEKEQAVLQILLDASCFSSTEAGIFASALVALIA
jgi:hypothetical protein